MEDNAEETLAGVVDLDALVGTDMRNLLDLHVEDDHTFMKHLVMLEIVQQRRRHRLRRAREEH